MSEKENVFKIKLLNYYDGLTEKQKEKLDEKKSLCIYYDYFDECENCGLTQEQTGVLMLAIIHFARYHGTKELPEDLSNQIENNSLLFYMFNTWMKREKQASINWINHRKETIKNDEVEIETPNGKITLCGNKKNMPTRNDFIDMFQEVPEASIVYEFIKYGNEKKWNKYWQDLFGEF